MVTNKGVTIMNLHLIESYEVGGNRISLCQCEKEALSLKMFKSVSARCRHLDLKTNVLILKSLMAL